MSADLPAAARLLDEAKDQGFAFERTGEGEDAFLRGKRVTTWFIDEIVVAGFSNSCEATRRHRYSLIAGEASVTARVSGDAVTVLRTVVTEWTASGAPDER